MRLIANLLFFCWVFNFSQAYAQVLYFESCSVPCEKCKPQDPMKVEYKADKEKNIVMRILNDSRASIVQDCSVMDKDNWVCEGVQKYSDLGKQYSVKGVAHWISSTKPENGTYHCEFDKSIFGNFKSRSR